ncbi:hypothetical protein BN971_00544 [Mycobacterium bohemicum DSM 44277]|nr:DUF732 domain-containing protein [Mycobacterium bohemicum]MCV6968466.1 DUF732 domain-containing protein [Mycobacterium bohemicum]CPR05242.1 hypothetical protein BN971_00544 [Mycobacterium bohemicum DSM 44277]
MTSKLFKCTFGALGALLLVPPAIASADNKDVEFANYLESDGIHLGTVSQTADMGRAMCHDLSAGYSQNDEITQLSQKLSPDQARLFVLVATTEYCPEKHKS